MSVLHQQPSPEYELYYAASRGDVTQIQLLLQDGADVHWQRAWPSDGDCALHQAALYGRQQAVQVLLDAGANITQSDDRGRTPLHRAASMGHAEIVQMLLEAGHPANLITSDDGLTPLHLACSTDRPRCVQILLDAGAGPNSISDRFSSPLSLAASYGHLQCVTLLVEGGADINLADNEGSLPCHVAAMYGHTDCLSYLCANGSVVDSMDDYDRTPLLLAADNEHLACVDVLMTAGALALSAINKCAALRQWRTAELLLLRCEMPPHEEIFVNAVSDVRLSIVALAVCRGVWPSESRIVEALVCPVARRGELSYSDAVDIKWLQHVYTDSRLADLLHMLYMLFVMGIVSSATLYRQLSTLIPNKQSPQSLSDGCTAVIRKCAQDMSRKLPLPSALLSRVSGAEFLEQFGSIPPICWDDD